MTNSILDSQYASPNALLTSHGFPVNTSGNTVLLSHSPAGTYPDPGGGSPDTQPAAFSFGTNPTGLALSAGTQTSDAATITDITAASAFTFSGTDGSCEWRKYTSGAWGSWGSAGSGSCINNDQLQLRHTAGTGYSQTVSGTITFTSGSVSATFSSTTIADPAGINLTHGSEFTITTAGTGLSFGTRAAKPLVYDNFESGTVGADIHGNVPTIRPSGSTFTWSGSASASGNTPKYSTAYLRGPNTRSSLHAFYPPDGYRSALQIDNASPNTGDEVYFSFWRYFDSVSGTWPQNIKPWMAHGTNGDDTPQMYTGWDDVLTGDGELRWAIQETGITVPNNYDTVPVLNAWAAEDRWVRIEGYFKQSTPDTADGVFHTDFHQDTPRIDRLCSSDAVMTRYTSAYWAQWAFGTYASVDERSPTAVANAYLSNVYFDNTRQRIELGNNSVYASCTRREVQPSTAWSDTSITALCQKGAIPTGTAYLFVIGADGTASAGIEVDVA